MNELALGNTDGTSGNCPQQFRFPNYHFCALWFLFTERTIMALEKPGNSIFKGATSSTAFPL